MGQRTFLRGGTAAVALACAAGPVLADVTAEEVWNNWRTAAAASGQVITVGTETRTGDSLVLEDVRVSLLPDQPITITGQIASVTFRELGNGTVLIQLPASYPLTIASRPSDPDAFEIGLVFGLDGLQTVASGTPDAVRYQFVGPEMSVAVDSFRSSQPGTSLEGRIALTGMTGDYLVSGTSAQTFDMTATAETFTIDVLVEAQAADGRLALNAALDGIEFGGAGAGIPTYSTIGAMTSLPEGFAIELSYGVRGSTIDLAFKDRNQGFVIATKASDSALEFAFDRQGAHYAMSSGPGTTTMSGSDIPLPEITIASEVVSLAFDVPLDQGATPQDFSAEARVEGFTVDENVWGIFDPSGALPRDPASVVVALAGKANWLIDVFNPMAGGNVATPAEIYSLDLNEFLISAVGASVTGTGGFTFDNSDLVTFNGMPRPSGSVTFEITGANALIDRLASLGFLPDDQAAGARMMLGLFARPGGGEDVLSSTVEVRDDGGVWANGQRLQ